MLTNCITLFPFLASDLYRDHFYDGQGHVTRSCKGDIDSQMKANEANHRPFFNYWK